MIDTFRHKGLRKNLVKELREKGIQSELILSALAAVPRHFFLDKAFIEAAYTDQAFQIGEGQTISQPYTVARQTELLEINRNEKVLEIGTGSGYQACVLAELGARVYTIERQKKLHDKVKKTIDKTGYRNIKFFFGDGYLGLPSYAPYDKAIVTAAAPFIPQPLLDQLKVGGILVIPVNEGKAQRMKKVIKISETETEIEDHGAFQFVPMLEGKNW